MAFKSKRKKKLGMPLKAYPETPRRVVQHGELHDKVNKRWCSIHSRWIKDAKWDKHLMCDITKEGKVDKKEAKPVGHGLRKTTKVRQTKGVPAWALEYRHGQLDKTKKLRFCAKHVELIPKSSWTEHLGCARKGSKPIPRVYSQAGVNRRGTTKKAKRVSEAVHYCILHGKFAGYTWGGHRRRCAATELSEQEWNAQVSGTKELDSTKALSSVDIFSKKSLDKVLLCMGILSGKLTVRKFSVKESSAPFPMTGSVPVLLVQKVEKGHQSLKKGDRISRINGASLDDRKRVITAIREVLTSDAKAVSVLVQRRKENILRSVEVPLSRPQVQLPSEAAAVQEVQVKSENCSQKGHTFVKSENLVIEAGNRINARLAEAQKVNVQLQEDLKELQKKIWASDDEVSKLETERGNFYGKLEEIAREVS